MLKKFFIAFMGSMAALWLSAFLFVVGFVLFIAMLLASMSSSMDVEDHTILYIDLHGAIDERPVKPSVTDVIYGGIDKSVPTLDNMLESIRLAASDSRIDGIYINCNGSELGYASRRELVEAIKQFKKSGKWVYAYGDNYTQGDYFVASAATRIFANPECRLDLHGISSTVPFFKNALDKIGVDVQVFKVGQFKSAVEPYLLTEMSEPARLQTQVFLDNIWGNVGSQIAEARKIEKTELMALADSILVARPAEYLVEKKLVDELCYRRVFEDKLRKLTKQDKDEDLRLVAPADYLIANNISEDQPSPDEAHVAVLYAIGDIVDQGDGGIVAADLVPQIVALAEDENVAGVVLRVNSGGGSAFASEQIWEALEYLKKKGKPLYVSMGDYAASGGYYISCGADRIYADAETLTGSIGIFGMIPCGQKLLNNHLGVTFSTVSTNSNAAFPQIVAPMTQQQYAAMQRNVENGYKLFTNRVAEGRGIDIAKVLEIAEGRVWDGQSALELGLVDELGSLETAINAMVKKTKLERWQVIAYPTVEISPLEEMILTASSSQAAEIRATTLGLDIEGMKPEEIKRYMAVIQRMTSCTPLQARMEDLTLE